MSAAAKNVLHTLWDSLLAVRDVLPVLTAGEQTRLSWARPVESLADVPAAYRGFFDDMTGDAPFPYAVLTPSYASFISKTTEKLVCFYDTRLVILENTGQTYTATAFAVDDLSYVEVGTILLEGWIKFSGKTAGDVYTAITVKFNSVTDYLFKPILAAVRAASADEADERIEQERAKFTHLATVHFKFMNAARRSLAPGDTVIQWVMQPEIRRRIAGRFHLPLIRPLAPAHICILTDRELIIISDDHRHWTEETKYGSIATYVPLAKIAGCTLTEQGSDLLALSIHLPGADRLETFFTLSNRQACERLAARITDLASRLAIDC